MNKKYGGEICREWKNGELIWNHTWQSTAALDYRKCSTCGAIEKLEQRSKPDGIPNNNEAGRPER
jgi:hypothetical protein